MLPGVTPSDQIISALDDAGYRLTAPRRAVATLVAERASHFTADELVSAARRRHLGVGRATVFRALELFVDLGLVERVDLPSGDHAYVGCVPGGVHHHHIVCSSCGRAADVDACGLQEAVEVAGRATGYEVTHHRLELFGVCPDCQARSRAAH